MTRDAVTVATLFHNMLVLNGKLLLTVASSDVHRQTSFYVFIFL